MSDLAEQIIDAIDWLDQLAAAAIDSGGYSLTVVGVQGEAYYFNAMTPEDARRRCAADREIVELHIRIWLEPGAPEFNDAHLTSEPMPVCASCRPETMFRRANSWPCRTLLAVARGYGIQP